MAEKGKYILAGLAAAALLLLSPKKTYAYFKISDFDSDDLPGSGVNMSGVTLSKLDNAERIAGKGFMYTSGYRTFSKNAAVGGVVDSSHTKGRGVDILTLGQTDSKRVAKALYQAGFRRFGLNSSYTLIHVDDDPTKFSPALWGYSGLLPPYNPANL